MQACVRQSRIQQFCLGTHEAKKALVISCFNFREKLYALFLDGGVLFLAISNKISLIL